MKIPDFVEEAYETAKPILEMATYIIIIFGIIFLISKLGKLIGL